MTFENLNLIEPLLKAVKDEGYENPTPIQAQAIPGILQGRDLLASASTGTGKTAAFVLPMLQKVAETSNAGNSKRNLRALILAPTRELAVQIGDNIKTYSKFLNLKHVLIYGGVSQRTQTEALRRGVDIVVATPGRFLDLLEQGHLNLKTIDTLILDEADRMLDMGFITDIKMIISRLPEQKQTLFFSATISNDIEKLSKTLLTNPLRVEIEKTVTQLAAIEEKLFFVEKKDKKDLLVHILETVATSSVLIFTGTKIGAEKMSKELNRIGLRAEAIHGGKTQNFRQKALDNFSRNRVKILVATDVAARGIDVEKLPFVINYNLPTESETYVHRIGRTGRAGSEGTAISLCDEEDFKNLYFIEKLMGKSIPLEEQHPFTSERTLNMAIRKSQKRGAGSPEPKRDFPRRNGGGNRRFSGRNEGGKKPFEGNRDGGRDRGGFRERKTNSEFTPEFREKTSESRERPFESRERTSGSRERTSDSRERNNNSDFKPKSTENQSDKKGFYSGKNKRYGSAKRGA